MLCYDNNTTCRKAPLQYLKSQKTPLYFASMKSLSELNNEVDQISATFQGLSTLKLLAKAIDNLEQYKRSQNTEAQYVHYQVALIIITELIPKHPDYASFVHNRERKDIYDATTDQLFTDTHIAKVKETLGTASNTVSNADKDALLERFNRLKSPDSLNIHYRSRTPSPKKEVMEVEKVDDETFAKYNNTVFITSQELFELVQKHHRCILLLDVRTRKEFDKSHLLAKNIVCIEPFTIKNNVTEAELEKSLLISPDFEQQLFKHRNLFELVVMYDNTFATTDATDLSQIPKTFQKLLTTLNTHSAFKPLKRNPLILNGGFNEWCAKFGSNYKTKPRVETLVQPKSLPSRPLSFRSMPSYDAVLPPSSRESQTQDFESDSPVHVPYAKSLQSLLQSEKKSPTPSHLPSLKMPERAAFSSPNSPLSPMPKYDNGNKNGHSEPQQNIQQNGYIPMDFTSGLYNISNTCYMNCVLQCLSGTEQLSLIFLNNSYRNHINVNSKLGSKGVLAKSYYEILRSMSKANGGYIVPTKFKAICGSINSEFKGFEQQDCQEFLNFLLDGLHEDLNQCGGNPPLKDLTEEEEAKRETLPFRIASTIEWERYLTTNFSVIVDLFQGQYLSRLRCLVCKHTSTTYQAFSTLSLPIPHKPANRDLTLDDCFQEFTKTELLDGDDKWRCPKCKQFQRSTKVLKITRLPKILIIHFKRFEIGRNIQKLDSLIRYPADQEIQLSQYWTPVSSKDEAQKLSRLQSRGQVPPFNYRVYGVINHYGTLKSGHYTSYVYKGVKKGWCYYDDTKITMNKKVREICSKDNYVLFLRRV